MATEIAEELKTAVRKPQEVRAGTGLTWKAVFLAIVLAQLAWASALVVVVIAVIR